MIIIDSSNEVTGDGDISHEVLGRVRRVKVGDPAQQTPTPKCAICSHSSLDILIKAVGDDGDVLEPAPTSPSWGWTLTSERVP